MAPDVRRFPVSDLPLEIQTNQAGRKRKPQDNNSSSGGGDIDLAKCKLFTLSQYECDVSDSRRGGDGRIHCYEVVRYFRRCADKKGNFTVETTTWETRESVAKAMSESNS